MINNIKQINGVKDVHDIHVWSISPEIRAMNGHILIEDVANSQAADIRLQIEKLVQEQYHIDHTTLQMECCQCESNETFCDITGRPSGEKKHEHRDTH